MKSKKRNWLKLSLQGGTLLAIVAFILYGIFFGEQRADPEAMKEENISLKELKELIQKVEEGRL